MIAEPMRGADEGGDIGKDGVDGGEAGHFLGRRNLQQALEERDVNPAGEESPHDGGRHQPRGAGGQASDHRVEPDPYGAQSRIARCP